MIKFIAEKILRLICNPIYYDDVRGDLEEYYRKVRKSHSSIVSDTYFLIEIFSLLRPTMWKAIPSLGKMKGHVGLYRNYLLMAARNLRRRKGYTLINILGLSIGMISVFYIVLFVKSEISYDKHHKDVDRLFRVHTVGEVNGIEEEMATSPPGLVRRIIADLPEIGDITRVVSFLGIKKNSLKVSDDVYAEEGGYLADPNFFEMFNYELLHGDINTLLDRPQCIVLSKKLSDKMFGSNNPVDKTLVIINEYGQSEYEVTGVYDAEKFPSHLSPNFICSMNSGEIGKYVHNNDRIQGNNFLYTYVKIGVRSDPEKITEKMPQFLSKYVENITSTHTLFPLRDIYLHSDATNELEVRGSFRNVIVLSTISLLILLIAYVNYSNMATSLAVTRAKEIGLRKTFGANKGMLIQQFLSEAVVVSIMSLILSFGIIFITTPYYIHLTGVAISSSQILESSYLLLLIALITSLSAGSYPAFYLSSLQLKDVIGGSIVKGKSNNLTRNLLMSFQFGVGLLLIFSAIVIDRQMDFMNDKPLGFKSTNLLAVPLPSENVTDQLESLKSVFRKIPGVVKLSGTSYSLAETVLSDNNYTTLTTGSDMLGVSIMQNDVDFESIEIMGFRLLAGRSFDKNISAENNTSVVLNETAVSAHWIHTAVGHWRTNTNYG